MKENCPTLQSVRAGKKRTLSDALTAVEKNPEAEDVLKLLDDAWNAPESLACHVLGITGPPGVGKSTLVNALIGRWRDLGKTVGVIAVDPSSKKSGGALLGDRTRLATNPDDEGVFVRSMAARDRLGGISDITFPAMVLMRAVFDIVIVETVGVGQSETDIVGIADTVMFCVQPGSGDSLQFMKAGIVEIPDIAVVTKADMGAAATRAMADLSGALGLSPSDQEQDTRIFLVAAPTGEGLAELMTGIDERWRALGSQRDELQAKRREQGQHWLTESIAGEVGQRGLSRLERQLSADSVGSPFRQRVKILSGLA